MADYFLNAFCHNSKKVFKLLSIPTVMYYEFLVPSKPRHQMTKFPIIDAKRSERKVSDLGKIETI